MVDVSVVRLERRFGAGIEVRTTWPDMVPTIRKTFDRLYGPGALDRSTHGHNFIVYKDGTKDSITLVVGVENAQPGGADRDIKGVAIPEGKAVTAPHFGDYGAMRPTYTAMEAFMAANGFKRNGVSLELYGDWGPDPEKVRTDLYIFIDDRI